MKTSLIFLLGWLLLLQPLAAIGQEAVQADSLNPNDNYRSGYDAGRNYARGEYDAGHWLVGGLAGGFALSLLGAGGIAAWSQKGKQPPKSELLSLQTHSAQYRQGFKQGYSDKARKSALVYAAIGGLAGIGLMLAYTENSK